MKTGYSTISGNYVYVNFPRLGKNAIYQHLDSISVKTNQVVDQDTIIGYVGETGEVTGIHLHFGWFDESEQNKDWYDRNWQDFEKYEYTKPLGYVGTPVLRDENNDQIQVLVSNLRARKEPNGEILGYINKGIYNILANQTTDGYTWYQVNDNYWIAYDESWTNLFLKAEIPLVPSPDLEENESDNSETNLPDLEENKENPPKTTIFERFFQGIGEIIKKILKFFKIL